MYRMPFFLPFSKYAIVRENHEVIEDWIQLNRNTNWMFFVEKYFFMSWLQPIGNIAERFQALCLKDSGVLYEDPYIQVCYSSVFGDSYVVLKEVVFLLCSSSINVLISALMIFYIT